MVDKDFEAARTLLEQNNDPEEQFHGWTPLMKASELGDIDIMTLLIEHGADVNARSGKGRTPISFAAENARRER